MKINNIKLSGFCSKAIFVMVEYQNFWGTVKTRQVSLGISIFNDRSIHYNSMIFTDNDENIFNNEGLKLMIIREYESHLKSIRKDLKFDQDEIQSIRNLIASDIHRTSLQLESREIGFGQERTFAEQHRQKLNRLMDKLTANC